MSYDHWKTTEPEPDYEPEDAPLFCLGCNCRMESVSSASLDPPEPIINPWCPHHGGRDPDYERDRRLEEAR